MIRSGTVQEIDHTDGIWAYLDLGFSKNRTCGLVVGDGHPEEFSYHEATNVLLYLANTGKKVSAVIEAPLSVAFDANGNPTGRACERYNRQARYWYVGAGAIVTLAAMYLIKELDSAFKGKELVLYEGFVSFKQRDSTHGGDATLLRDTVVNREQHQSRIIAPDNLKQQPTDQIRGAFEVMGIESGIPPIIAVFG